MRTALLKEMREARGITLERLSADVNISVSQLSRFESGTRYPRVHELERIADRLGVEPWLFLDKQPPASKRVNEGLPETLVREALVSFARITGMSDIGAQKAAARVLEAIVSPPARVLDRREDEVRVDADRIARQHLEQEPL